MEAPPNEFEGGSCCHSCESRKPEILWIPAGAGMTIFCSVGSWPPKVGVTRQKLYTPGKLNTPGHLPDKVGNKTCRNVKNHMGFDLRAKPPPNEFGCATRL
jgi:hypothetical protein